MVKDSWEHWIWWSNTTKEIDLTSSSWRKWCLRGGISLKTMTIKSHSIPPSTGKDKSQNAKRNPLLVLWIKNSKFLGISQNWKLHFYSFMWLMWCWKNTRRKSFSISFPCLINRLLSIIRSRTCCSFLITQMEML